MNDSKRIPIPWNQRWEEFRWRAFPVLCFVATVAACGWLWRQQAQLQPFALGEVHSVVVEVRSPVDGVIVPVDGQASGQWQLLAQIKEGDEAIGVKPAAADAQIAVVRAPFSGQVTQVFARLGQSVRAGEPVLKLTSPRADFIVCHLPQHWQAAAAPGTRVAVRRRDANAAWIETTIESVGPGYEVAPAYESTEANIAQRGLPVRIALPQSSDLKPGVVVEVRFAG
jgi:multidrug resistance efflux pump